ncbi:MAG: Lrp/AsnC family transcriptional regulator [Candidatus Nanohaloarchaea archaeon]|nr:Lrp/AsnC family transcriptional regulator [Candidatus Nanohaloarchaea archaeon]
MSLDDLDFQIIEQLTEDGRASLRNIAEQLDISPSTVSSRMRKLRHEGVIKGFQPVLDYSQMGFDLTAVVEVAVSTDMLAENEHELQELPNVVSLYEVTGDHDVVMLCKFRDREEMNRLVKNVLSMHGVESTHTRVALTAPIENEIPALEKGREEGSE